jgi:hypothetical protein
MIIQQQKYDSIVVGLEGKNVGIDTSRAEKLKYFFSQGIYSHPFESVVRELASNILDAYVHSDVDIKESPGIVRLTEDSISFQDFGVGMSEELFDNVYCQMLNSTKEEDADSIGAWGIGSKSPWAVSSQFYLSTVYNGVKRDYVLNKEAGNDKVYPIKVEETDLPNGTLVTVPIKKEELSKWIKACEVQLAFFKHIVFDCNVKVGYGNYSSKHWNEEPIIDAKTFFFRTTFESKMENYIYVALEQVVYSVKCSDLGIPSVKCPIVFKCSTKDGLIPTLSRENLIINQHTKDLILRKMQEAFDELFLYVHKNEYLVDYLRKQNTVSFKILDLDIHWNYSFVKDLIKSGKFNIDISFFLNPLYIRNGEPIHTLSYFWDLFHFKQVGSSKLTQARTSLSSYKHQVTVVGKDIPFKFLKENYLYSGVIKKPKLYLFKRKQWDYECLHYILQLHYIPRDQWRELCNQFIKDVEYYVSTCKIISEDELLKHKQAVKEESKQKRLLTKKSIKDKTKRGACSIYAGQYVNRKTKKIPLGFIDPTQINKKLNVYSTDETLHLNWIEMLPNCKAWYVQEKYVHNLQGVQHWISLEDFYKSKKLKQICYKQALSTLVTSLNLYNTNFKSLPSNIREFLRGFKKNAHHYRNLLPTSIQEKYLAEYDRQFIERIRVMYQNNMFLKYDLDTIQGVLNLKQLLRENRLLKAKLNLND